MLDVGTLVVLRSIAAVAAAVPTIGVRVQSRGRDVIVVPGATTVPSRHATAVVLRSPSFRLVVAAAYADHRSGAPIELPGIPCELPVRIDVELADRDVMLPEGIYRCRRSDRVWQGFPTTLDLLGARAAVTDGAAVRRAIVRPPGFTDVSLHHDPAIGITLVHAEAPRADAKVVGAIAETLQTLSPRCRVHELLAEGREG